MNIHRTIARRIAEDNGFRLIADRGLHLWIAGTAVTLKQDRTGRIPMTVDAFEELITSLAMERAADEGKI